MSLCARCAFRHGLPPARRTSVTGSRLLPATSLRSFTRQFSTSVWRQADPSTSKPASAKSKPASSVVAGTALKGLNYITKLSDPVALSDEEYPSWLWTVLEDRRPQLTSTPQISAEDAADLYSKSKNRRRLAAKRIAAKEAAGTTTLAVPADHRTEDMPYETYEESQAAIKEAKRTARARRKALIKEKNFLWQLG